MYNHVSNLPAVANNSSASVFKPQLAKLACSVSLMWRSIDRLHSLMGRFSVLKYQALEPHFISNENRAIKKSMTPGDVLTKNKV